jgi:ABC-2 type transport system ATP-binding protein
MTAIRTEGLTKFYGDVRGIEDVTFDVREGEVFGFLGPNGAGKTTAMRTLLGFLKPTGGDAWLLGHDVSDPDELRAAKARVGYLPSDPGLDEGVTGKRLLRYYSELQGDERSDELLELFDPPLDRKVGEYSRGNKQMLALVLAFMHDPDLLVMDEPTSGLDPLKQERFNEFLRDEVASGKTAFLSSHVLSEVQKTCDRVGIIRNGHLAEVETVDDLLTRGGKVVSARFGEPVGRDEFDLPGADDLRVTDEDGTTSVAFTFTGNYDTLLAQLADHTVLDLDVHDAPLEDVFMRFYGEEPGTAPSDEGDPAAEETGEAGVTA